MSETLAGLSSPLLQSLLMPENAQRYIDLEIQKLEDNLRCLKSRRNMLSPISRLPPEILSQIFYAVSTIAVPRDHLHWIKVTHVSRHWRATAINCPNLWSNIDTSCPNWTEEMLRRSKTTGLNLNVKFPHNFKDSKVVQLALQYIARMKNLTIAAPNYVVEALLANLPVDTPILESFSLSVFPFNNLDKDNHFVLPKKLFTGDTSRLKRLELYRCCLNWHSPVFCGLTVLKIQDVPPSKRPTTSQLVEILGKMPALEFLHLEEALPLISDATTSSKPADRVINLPRLSHTAVLSTVPECTNLFNHVAFPRNATYSIKTEGPATTGYDFSTILNVISNSESSIRTLHIRVGEKFPNLNITGWFDSFDSGSGRNKPLVELDHKWTQRRTRHFESVITAACNVLSLAHLEALYLSNIGDSGIKPNTWATLFGNLPKIRFVELKENSASTFISALKQQPTSSSTTQPTPGKSGSQWSTSGIPPVYFPNLQTLTIDDDFDCNDLIDCLMERCERNAKLRSLHLVLYKQYGHPFEDDLELLRDFVVDLTWTRLNGSPLAMSDHDGLTNYSEFDVYDSDFF